MAKISVLGSGSWGLALALLLHNNGHEVLLWSARPENARKLREKRENPDRLPGVRLPDEIDVLTDMERALKDVDVTVLICTGICGEYSYSGKRTDGHCCGKESCDDFFLHNFFLLLKIFSFFIFLYKMNCLSYDFAVSFCNIFSLTAGCCRVAACSDISP